MKAKAKCGGQGGGEKAKAKESVIRKLRRLVPGEPVGINAMKNVAGAITTSPEEIAQVLK